MRLFSFKKIKNLPRPLLWLIAWILRIYAKTIRLRCVNSEAYLEGKKVVVFAVWHNRFISLPVLLPSKLSKYVTTLISNSRDGEYIAGLVREFGVEPVRGSSSKGALHALHELSDAIGRGLSPIITVDGPRGPRYEAHPGANMLAMKHGIPIVPLSVNCSSYWQLKSWDRLQIPRPFSKVEILFGEPIFIPKNTPREKALEMLADAMKNVTKDK